MLRKAIGFVLVSSVPISVWAQALPPLPKQPTRDANGVDISGWGAVFEWNSMSIGDPAQGGIVFTHYLIGGNNRDNFTADLTFHDVNSAEEKGIATLGAHTAVSNGGPAMETPGSTVSHGSVTGNWTMGDGTAVNYFSLEPDYEYDAQFGTPMFLYATSVTRPNGEILTYHNKTYQPDPGGANRSIWWNRVQSITSNHGYQIKFEYATNTLPTGYSAGNWTTRTKAILINNAYEYCNPNADTCSLSLPWPSVTYQTTNSGGTLIESYTNHAAETLRVRNGREIQRPGASSYDIAYVTESYVSPYASNLVDFSYRTKSVTKDGKTWNYGYTAFSAGESTLTVQAPDGSTSQYRARAGGATASYLSWPPLILWSKDGLGFQTTYTYNSHSQILSAQYPEGNALTVAYDVRGNPTQSTASPKSGSGLSNITSGASYATSCSACGRPDSTTDALGRTTNYTWTYGQLASEMGPAPTTGAARPLRLRIYAQKSAYILNGSGTLVSTGQPIWLPATETLCQTAAGSSTPTCDPGAPQTVTTFLYGANGTPDNLMLRGIAVTADGETLRTCYSYDKWSRKISETAPNANLSSCS